VPPVLEVLGLAEVEHNARNNRMRAKKRRGISLTSVDAGHRPTIERLGYPVRPG
jgi:hypothetical protein